MNETQIRLIHAAFDVVSKTGLEGFSMRQVTTAAGVSSRLVYKYFETKENFLFECFRFVDKQIAWAFDAAAPMFSFDDPSAPEAIKQVWFSYFKFMVSLDKQALFYYAYRDSSYIKKVIEHDEESTESYFKGFQSYFDQLNIPETRLGAIDDDVLWTYIIDCTGVFAKRVIRGELPFNDDSVEQIWRLVSCGLMQK